MAPGLEWPRAAHRLVYTSSNRVRKKRCVVAAPKLSVFLLCSQGNCVCPVRVRVSSDRRRRGVAGAGPSF